ncbi:MAG TPA: hypothetical protein VFD42_01485 [Chloroflexota bacterium]|nr:hypothetical protein [Chloroflexota bacterium]
MGIQPDDGAASTPLGAIRPAVISREISGGTRTGEGTRTKGTPAGIFGTWAARGLNPFSACLSLLTTPSPL